MKTNKRDISIDFLRGLVLIIMTLDHVRDSFYNSPIGIGGIIISTLTPSLFFTRWITHFCAPTFAFLAGISIFLNQQRNNLGINQIVVFNIKRGLFFIFLEFTLFSFLFNHSFESKIYTKLQFY